MKSQIPISEHAVGYLRSQAPSRGLGAVLCSGYRMVVGCIGLMAKPLRESQLSSGISITRENLKAPSSLGRTARGFYGTLLLLEQWIT